MAKNHPMNTSKGSHSPKIAPIQGSSANYAGMKKSGRTTPSPANNPYPAVTRNAAKPSGKTILPPARVK